MKYLVRDCDPNTGEPDDDGYDDEYVVCGTRATKGRREELVSSLAAALIGCLRLRSWRTWR